MTFTVFGDKETATYFRLTGQTLPARVNPVIQHYAEVLKMGIIAFSSGRPGPEIDTGFYHESWVVEFSMEGDFLVAEISSGAPYANRLEYGFAGTDSLGRVYHQPPFPHIGPASDIVAPNFEDALAKVVLI